MNNHLLTVEQLAKKLTLEELEQEAALYKKFFDVSREVFDANGMASPPDTEYTHFYHRVLRARALKRAQEVQA